MHCTDQVRRAVKRDDRQGVCGAPSDRRLVEVNPSLLEITSHPQSVNRSAEGNCPKFRGIDFIPPAPQFLLKNCCVASTQTPIPFPLPSWSSNPLPRQHCLRQRQTVRSTMPLWIRTKPVFHTDQVVWMNHNAWIFPVIGRCPTKSRLNTRVGAFAPTASIALLNITSSVSLS